eukprot:TRINITY_DN2777_c0_g1_i2.p1 TRINITY_DN2777_c0_g1~~TRINITY_DN2777_c0_g1_i2.p1  ORF type:complete len:1128 (+),score=264.36 TRINITY_DN2777_c0_g1_i2:54-3437(+)
MKDGADSYKLPPRDDAFAALLGGLKRFHKDLSVGNTDSSAVGFGWSQAPSAAKIAAPQLLQPKPPPISLRLRDPEDRLPAPGSEWPKQFPKGGKRPRPRSAGLASRTQPAEVRHAIWQTPETSAEQKQPVAYHTAPLATRSREASPSPLPPAPLSAREPRPPKNSRSVYGSSGGGQKYLWASMEAACRRPLPEASIDEPEVAALTGSSRATASNNGGTVPSRPVAAPASKATKQGRPCLAPLPLQSRPGQALTGRAAAVEEEHAARQPRTMEEYVARANQRLLSLPGDPSLIWRTQDSEADYRQLRPGEFFNHFQQNRVLTTKAGLAQCLAQHHVCSGTDADAFFPRCYDISQKSEREDFILDFRRSAALKVAQLHRRLHDDQKAGLGSFGYLCNVNLIKATEAVLQRWCHDLDAEHLDEEDSGESKEGRLSEETWDALMLYSELTQAQLCSDGADEPPVRMPRRRSHRPAGGDLEGSGSPKGKRSSEGLSAEGEPSSGQGNNNWRPAAVREWPEFHSHCWAKVDEERQERLNELLQQLERLLPQWCLQGGWSGRNVWIVKPGTNSKGSGIECMCNLPDLLHHCDRMPNRIVQKYIERPLLLFSGRKFDIRQWVLVKSVYPLKVFLFSECYLRLCNGMYDLGDLRDRERHISNWQVNKHGRNVVEGAVVSLDSFREELLELTGRQDFWEAELLPQLSRIVVEALRSAEGSLTPRKESFELFGFDLMVDEAFKLWLLEVNLSPGCEGRTPFLERMLDRMSHRMIEVAVLGKEHPDGEQPDWVKICDDAVEGGAGALAAADAMRRAADPLRPPCPMDLDVRGLALRPPKPRAVVAQRPSGQPRPGRPTPRQVPSVRALEAEPPAATSKQQDREEGTATPSEAAPADTTEPQDRVMRITVLEEGFDGVQEEDSFEDDFENESMSKSRSQFLSPKQGGAAASKEIVETSDAEQQENFEDDFENESMSKSRSQFFSPKHGASKETGATSDEEQEEYFEDDFENESMTKSRSQFLSEKPNEADASKDRIIRITVLEERIRAVQVAGQGLSEKASQSAIASVGIAHQDDCNSAHDFENDSLAQTASLPVSPRKVFDEDDDPFEESEGSKAGIEGRSMSNTNTVAPEAYPDDFED